MSQLTIAAAPSYNDLADSVLEANQPLTSDALTKISHNIKLGVERPETIFMGFYKHGDQVPAPVSPVDGYAYTISTEVTWHFHFYSTRAPGVGFQSGQSNAPPIAASQAGNLYWWTVDISNAGVVAINIGYLNNSTLEADGNDGMVKVYAVCQRVGPTSLSWADIQTTGAGSTTIVDSSATGQFQPWHVGYDLNIGTGGSNFVPGSYLINGYVSPNSVTVASSPSPSGTGLIGNALLGIPNFLDIPDGVFAVSQPVKQGFASGKYGITDLSHNGKAGTVRCEIIPMGYYANGATIPLPQSPVDGYFYNRGEVQYRYVMYSSLQPTGGFVNGQTTAPTIGSGLAKHIGIGPLYWHSNDIDFTTGIVTTNVSYYVHGGAETITNDGIVKVIAICQRHSVNAAIVGLGGSVGFSTGITTLQPGGSANTAAPDAPVVGVIRGLQSQGSSTYLMIIGVEPVEDDLGNVTAQNWNGLIATEIQIASDSGFTQLNNGPLTGATPNAGGTGYALNDVLTVVQGGASGGTVQVIGVNAGIVTAVSVLTAGSGYTVSTGVTTTGGTGHSCTLDISAIFDVANLPPALPPINYNFATNFPGTYYIRAREENGFGFGAWSNTLIFNTNSLDNSTADTGLMDAPVPVLTSNVSGSDPSIPGNAISIAFSIPPNNSATFFGYQIFIWNSFTLPTATTSFVGTQGQMVSGSTTFTDPSATWTPGQWASGFDLVAFSTARGGSPTFDYEGWVIFAEITANTATQLTFAASPQTVHLSETGLKYYIVQRGVGAHFFEKLVAGGGWYSPTETDTSVTGGATLNQSSDRNIAFPSAISGDQYCFVTCFNIFGSGKVVTGGTVPHARFHGITTLEISDSAITTAKIATGAVISSKLTASAQSFISTLTFSASSNTVVAWTSGVVKTADGNTYIITAANTGVMSGATYIYLDPAVSGTSLQVTTSLSPSDTAILLCYAQNTTDPTQDAMFIPAIGVFGINNTNVGPNSIATVNIQAVSITTALLAAGAVTAAKISVASLDAIAVNAGTLTAGTLVGLSYATATSGGRVVIDPTNGLQFYNSGGTLETQVTVSGIGLALIKTSIIYGISADVISLQSNTSATGVNFGSSSSTTFILQTSGTTRFTVDSSSTPLAAFSNLSSGALTVCDTGAVTAPANTNFYVQSDIQGNITFSIAEAAGGSTQILQRHARGSHASPSDSQVGDAVATFGYNAYSAGYIGGTYMLIRLVSTTSGQRPATALHLRSNNLNAGMTDFLVGNNDQSVSMPFYAAGSASFTTGGLLTSSSDERLKDILERFAGGLAEVLKIKPIVYRWNEKFGPHGHKDDQKYIGFSAQEVERQVPLAVSHSRDGWKGLHDRGLIALHHNAIQELNAKVEALDSELSRQRPIRRLRSWLARWRGIFGVFL